MERKINIALVVLVFAVFATGTWYFLGRSQYRFPNTGGPVNLTQTGGFVTTGQGANTLAYSTDGGTWNGLGISVFAKVGTAVAWNGTMWVATGQGINTLAYSTDGINWTGLGSTIFSAQGGGVAWNGTMWVATGQGTNTLAYSIDGINWTGLGTSIFSSAGYGVAWNGTMWVATGVGGNSLAHSSDGINWTGLGTIYFSVGTSVAWNGTIWVATGQGINTLAYSADGINWTGLGTTVFNGIGYGVAWNGNTWIAAGGGVSTLAYSTDGIHWTGQGASVFSAFGHSVTWNGSMWVATGAGINTIAYSVDGMNWIGVGESLFSPFGGGVASAPRPNLYPAVALTVVPQGSGTSGGGQNYQPSPITTPSAMIGTSATPIPSTSVTPAAIPEGSLISATGDPDIYIVNEFGFKRLFLNPAIFIMYGHLRWDSIVTVDASVRDSYTTSLLFRDCESNALPIYVLEPTAEDTGILHWLNISAQEALSSDPAFFSKVFCINTTELNFYGRGTPYTSLGEMQTYSR